MRSQKALTPEERSEAAPKVVQARWAKSVGHPACKSDGRAGTVRSEGAAA